ncbi:hypothetical protein JTE90_002359 [Oedothorax gibbosus]|uniref:DNA mismatch repair proteins mutS family domain-containing protein n=1 Tax=Oedothorax gibbosus TaxID=931172 RepID=A0AAV6ULE7_9ARAC|nr:hypothetical protein JTE90_002359 [Oedothorax gibbosus]
MSRGIHRSKFCSGTVTKGSRCIRCRCLRCCLLNKTRRSRAKTRKPVRNHARKLKARVKSNKLLQQKVIKLKALASKPKTKHFNIQTLPAKQRLAVAECIKLSKRKSKGMIYGKQWVLEAIIMKIKSPRLYQHLRLNKILPLPSRNCLNKYLKEYKTGFGFNEKVLQCLREKDISFEEYQKHGALLFVEMKLSENFSVKGSGQVEGFCGYGEFTPKVLKNKPCDHGKVLLFQPFLGDWVQIVGVFATAGNMSGGELARILLEAILNVERAGLFVDCVVGDGASWNRTMWREFGIGVASNGEIKHKVLHPNDEGTSNSRYLHFLSDFPHLLKCIRNTLLDKGGFMLPEGEVRIEMKAACKSDKHALALRVPKVHAVHFTPNNFEKMRVNLAFQLFSNEMLKAMYLYKDDITAFCDPFPTEFFVEQMKELIRVMTSRIPKEALFPHSRNTQFLYDFLNLLEDWEAHCRTINTKRHEDILKFQEVPPIKQTVSDKVLRHGFLISRKGVRLTEANHVLKKNMDHNAIQRSDSRIIFYIAGSPAVKSPTNGDSSKVNSPKSATAAKNTNGKSKSPSSKSGTMATESQSETPKQSKLSRKRNVSDSKDKSFESDDSESDNITQKPLNSTKPKDGKRRRIVIASESEDSCDDYKPPRKDSSESDSEIDSPKKKKRTSVVTTSLRMFNKPKSSPNNSKLSTPNSNKLTKTSTPGSKQKISNGISEENQIVENDSKEWFHDKLDWLKNENIRDRIGKSKLDPDYNPKTLYVPNDFKKSLTPAMRQWWDLKSEHFDTVLFFKVGKFYELYHMDATIGVKELGLIYMKGDNAHSGFPEIAFGKYADCLVEKGYKVARVEQTETPQMMEQRCKKMGRQTTKFDKVVAREICQITSKGTKTLTYQGEGIGVCNNFLLAICEKPIDGAENASEYGICFIDTSIGKFNLGQFKDDRHGSRLLTLFALYPPVEILYDKGSVSKKTLQLLNQNLSGVAKQALSPNTEFWDSSKVLKMMQSSKYFNTDEDLVEYPKAIKSMLDDDDRLLQTPLKQYELAFKSLGGCFWYLRESGIDDCLLTMKLFEEYIPVDKVESTVSNESSKCFKKHMVLDGITLQNLEIVPLLPSDDSEGTLLGTMDYCSSSFGKRLFRNWLCSPLCNPESISSRLDAIDDLAQIPEVVESSVNLIKKLPDLERLLSKIHAFGVNRRTDHPESRAIFYDADIYNKRKINDFLTTLQGFREICEIVSLFHSHTNTLKSSLLKQCVCQDEETGSFPNLLNALDYFDHAFDHDLAKKQGNIIPSPGVDKKYDEASAVIKSTLKELDSFLENQKKALNCKVSYVGNGKNRYMLEVPENKKVPSGFEFQGGRKGFKRYYAKEVKDMLSSLTSAEESRDSALRDVTKNIFRDFDKDYERWKAAVHCISTLDVLISLTLYFKSSGVTMCRPKFSLPDGDIEPHLKIIDGIHPTFLKYYTGDDYIPNSVYIGRSQHSEDDSINDGGKVVLVTGPNMGGKSTLMRQAGTLVIMAHIGSYVPAESMELTPVDRIFTRVGASDRISKGESTFFVEASETSSILHHATSDSFVLIDELGRGTATFDGTAMASAALEYLANDIGCRTLFSTHYHSLVEDFRDHPYVGLGHMFYEIAACMVEKDHECPALEKITFLYKFVNGACPKSYGFNVALLAGITKQIVRHGFQKAQQLEYSTRLSKVFRNILSAENPGKIIAKLYQRLKNL